jgi:phage tail sheath gpL-like
MSTTIIIPGLSSSTKRPAFYGQTLYTTGPLATGSIPWNLLLVGNKTSAGSMTADGSPVQVFGTSEVDTYAGAGSELAQLAYGPDGSGGALAVQGLNVWLGCMTEATGGTAAYATAALTGGTEVTGGTINYRVCGVLVPVAVPVGATDAEAATALAAGINAHPSLPVTAATGGDGNKTVTVTAKNKGPRGNTFTLCQDTVSGPATITSTLAGATVALTNGGVHFKLGAGNDSATALIAAIASQQFDVIAIASGDTTLDAVNLALWKTALNNAAAATPGYLQHLVFAETDTLSNTAGLSTTTVNHARFHNIHMLEGETPASTIAGVVAGEICSLQHSDPGAGAQYAGMVLPGVVPQTALTARPTPAVVETALGEGVTELTTEADGTVRISRLITTYCRSGTTPDYRTLDIADAFVPDYCRTSAALLWTSDFQPNAPRVAPSVPAELKQPPAGVTTPAAWQDALTLMARQFERGEGLPYPILTDVDNNLPTAQWDSAGKFIVSAWPTKVMPGNYICGLSVRQVG